MIRTILTLNAFIEPSWRSVDLRISAEDIATMSKHETISSITTRYTGTQDHIDILESATVTARTNTTISISTANNTYTLFTV